MAATESLPCDSSSSSVTKGRSSKGSRPAAAAAASPLSATETVRRYRSREKERMQSLKQMYLNEHSKNTSLNYQVHQLRKERDNLIQHMSAHVQNQECKLKEKKDAQVQILLQASREPEIKPSSAPRVSQTVLPNVTSTNNWTNNFIAPSQMEDVDRKASVPIQIKSQGQDIKIDIPFQALQRGIASQHEAHRKPMEQYDVKVKEEPISPQSCRPACFDTVLPVARNEVKMETQTGSGNIPNGTGALPGLSFKRSNTALEQAMAKRSPRTQNVGSLEELVEGYSLPTWAQQCQPPASTNPWPQAPAAPEGSYSCTIGTVGSFHTGSSGHCPTIQSAMPYNTNSLSCSAPLLGQQGSSDSTASDSIRETHQLLASLNNTPMGIPGDVAAPVHCQSVDKSQNPSCMPSQMSADCLKGAEVGQDNVLKRVYVRCVSQISNTGASDVRQTFPNQTIPPIPSSVLAETVASGSDTSGSDTSGSETDPHNDSNRATSNQILINTFQGSSLCSQVQQTSSSDVIVSQSYQNVPASAPQLDVVAKHHESGIGISPCLNGAHLLNPVTLTPQHGMTLTSPTNNPSQVISVPQQGMTTPASIMQNSNRMIGANLTRTTIPGGHFNIDVTTPVPVNEKKLPDVPASRLTPLSCLIDTYLPSPSFDDPEHFKNI